MRRLPLMLLTVIALVSPVFAQDEKKEKSRTLEFRPLAELGAASENAQGPDGKPAIKITGSDTPTLVSVVINESPGISTHNYVIVGRIKYEKVAVDSFLELWNDFGERGQYFSRTLADGGPMGKMIGTSDWHEFALPFQAEPGMTPKKLTLNVVLRGPGTVVIEQPTARELPGPYFATGRLGIGALLGAILGTLLGVLGAIIGITACFENSRKWSLIFTKLGFVIGVILLFLGAAAYFQGQPAEISYPLLLCGFIGTIAFGVNVRGLAKRFREDELRRMTAADAV